VPSPTAIYKTRVPNRYRRRVTEARVTVRHRLDAERPLPGLLVIGAQRAGTSSLYKYLEGHPLLLASLRKETEYFSGHYRRGEAWYRAHFASRARHALLARRHGRPAIAFEATPYYLFHPLAPERAAALTPGAKLVVLLRDPVERAWSHYQHEARRGQEPLSFADALAAEPERLAVEEQRLADDPLSKGVRLNRYSYAAKGRYAEQLERWLAHFPRSQLLVLRTEDLFATPRQVLGEIQRFLDVPEWYPAEFENHSYPTAVPERSPVPDEVRERLVAEYAPHNRRLYELVGRDFGWDEGAPNTV
jgi:hypothetical protein